VALIFQTELWRHTKEVVDLLPLHSDILEKNFKQYKQTLQHASS
jgi:hypothetical protein